MTIKLLYVNIDTLGDFLIMMKTTMMLIVLVFLILMHTPNTAPLASKTRCRPLCHSITGIYKSLSLRCMMNLRLKPPGQGHRSGSIDYSIVHEQTRIQKIIFIHCTRKLLTPDEIVIIASLSRKTLNGVGIVPINSLKLSSNNLPDIFITPRTFL